MVTRSPSKYLKTKVVLWLTLVIGQITVCHLETSFENLVACAQFLVAFATSESQFQALCVTAVKSIIYSFLFIYLFIYYNSQRFPITVNVHVKD